MKVFAQLLVLPALLAACASHHKPAVTAPSESERNPSAASGLRVLQDKYGDTKVIYCTEKTAIVTSDPNKCGESTANGHRGCTELASYFSELLKVEETGTKTRLLDGSGTAVHEMTRDSGGKYTLRLHKNTPKITLSEAQDDGSHAALAKYVCKL